MIEWNDSFSVGVDIIDQDHKVLIDLINDTLAAAQTNNLSDINSVFRKLEGYTSFHFAREEGMMAECGYENIEEHKVYHNKLIDDLDECRISAMMSREVNEDSEICMFLKNWLFQHILKEDMQYVARMTSHFS